MWARGFSCLLLLAAATAVPRHTKHYGAAHHRVKHTVNVHTEGFAHNHPHSHHLEEDQGTLLNPRSTLQYVTDQVMCKLQVLGYFPFTVSEAPHSPVVPAKYYNPAFMCERPEYNEKDVEFLEGTGYQLDSDEDWDNRMSEPTWWTQNDFSEAEDLVQQIIAERAFKALKTECGDNQLISQDQLMNKVDDFKKAFGNNLNSCADTVMDHALYITTQALRPAPGDAVLESKQPSYCWGSTVLDMLKDTIKDNRPGFIDGFRMSQEKKDEIDERVCATTVINVAGGILPNVGDAISSALNPMRRFDPLFNAITARAQDLWGPKMNAFMEATLAAENKQPFVAPSLTKLEIANNQCETDWQREKVGITYLGATKIADTIAAFSGGEQDSGAREIVQTISESLPKSMDPIAAVLESEFKDHESTIYAAMCRTPAMAKSQRIMEKMLEFADLKLATPRMTKHFGPQFIAMNPPAAMTDLRVSAKGAVVRLEHMQTVMGTSGTEYGAFRTIKETAFKFVKYPDTDVLTGVTVDLAKSKEVSEWIPSVYA